MDINSFHNIYFIGIGVINPDNGMASVKFGNKGFEEFSIPILGIIEVLPSIVEIITQ